MSQDLTKQLERRPRSSNLAAGIVLVFFFAAIATWSALSAELNVDSSFPYPIPMAIFSGVFWGVWRLPTLDRIAASCRHEITITAQFTTQQGIFRMIKFVLESGSANSS